MTKTLRAVLALVLALSGALLSTGYALADVDNSTGTNVQEGDNRSTGSQSGRSATGDAVGGQVTGVVSSGRTSVDARNVSRDSDVTSGDASGNNNANTFTGLNTSPAAAIGAGTADISNSDAANLQEGDNRSTYNQTASYTTGDGVAGQVIGVVTAAGGSASVVAANTSVDSSVESGEAEGSNDLAAFTGLNTSGSLTVAAADITDSCATCANLQEGDNRTTARQASNASTGDGVAGQVIGVVSAGATSVDAANRSDGVDVQTGDAESNNDASLFTGLNTSGTTTVGDGDAGAADIEDSCNFAPCANVQEGDNRTTARQAATASTGDGVAGSVIGVVTSAGGSASVVAANTSTNSDVQTGDAESENDLAAFVGLNVSDSGTAIAADIANVCAFGCANLQEGDNRLTGSQTARANSGDGVAGQVIGVVSAGAASVDAANRSDDVSVETGDTDAHNDASEFVGLNLPGTSTVGGGDAGGPLGADIDSATAVNLQEGDNRKSLGQTADANSGDAVAGQVSGVVTSAGGSASVVLANTSTGIDSSTGDVDFSNDDLGFVGLNATFGPITILG